MTAQRAKERRRDKANDQLYDTINWPRNSRRPGRWARRSTPLKVIRDIRSLAALQQRIIENPRQTEFRLTIPRIEWDSREGPAVYIEEGYDLFIIGAPTLWVDVAPHEQYYALRLINTLEEIL